MLNKIELKGNEPVLYAVVVENNGVPQGSYLYKNLQTATQKFEDMARTVSEHHSLVLYTVTLTWVPLTEMEPSHDLWGDYKNRRNIL
jgi:hypothetical protein